MMVSLRAPYTPVLETVFPTPVLSETLKVGVNLVHFVPHSYVQVV